MQNLGKKPPKNFILRRWRYDYSMFIWAKMITLRIHYMHKGFSSQLRNTQGSLSVAAGMDKLTQHPETVGYRELQLHRATAATGWGNYLAAWEPQLQTRNYWAA